MKKSVVILLAFLHLFTVVGFSMNMHFCMGKTSVTVAGIDINKSCKCKHDEKKHSKKCCNNKDASVKADYSKDKTNNNSITVSKDFGVDVFALYSFAYIFNIQKSSTFIFANKGSPPKHSPPLFLLNSVFLI
jgi:hypothetical protein